MLAGIADLAAPLVDLGGADAYRGWGRRRLFRLSTADKQNGQKQPWQGGHLKFIIRPAHFSSPVAFSNSALAVQKPDRDF